MRLNFGSLTIIVGIIILIFLCTYLKYKKNKGKIYLFFFSIFFVYLLYVTKYTIFPIFFYDDQPPQPVSDYVNLIPFKLDLLSEQVLLNILLSIPFGFGIPFLTKINRMKKLLTFSVLFGTIIEMIQFLLIISPAFTYRIVDVNDILLNMIGVLIGFTLFKIFSRFYVYIVHRWNIELNSFLLYIDQVCREHNHQTNTWEEKNI